MPNSRCFLALFLLLAALQSGAAVDGPCLATGLGAAADSAEDEAILAGMIARDGEFVRFPGPNCFDAALLATGGIRATRYVSPREFEAILTLGYAEVSPRAGNELRRGDVLVYEHPQPHAAVVVDGERVFQMQGYGEAFPYRVLLRSEVEKTFGRPVRVFRRIPGDRGLPSLAPRETAQLELLGVLEGLVARLAPKGEISRKLGLVVEWFCHDLEAEFKSLGSHPDPVVRSRYAGISSLYGQLNRSIEYEALGSPFVTERDFLRVLFYDNAETRSLLEAYARVHGRTFSAEDFQALFAKLEKRRAGHLISPVSLAEMIRESWGE
jgi:hypothetical protein